jgi:hypothetical protein
MVITMFKDLKLHQILNSTMYITSVKIHLDDNLFSEHSPLKIEATFLI